MSESNLPNLIECTYGHHMADKDKDFTSSGLNKKYFTICRKCKTKETKKYRERHKDKFNDSRREYNRQWMSNKRVQEKGNKQNELENKQNELEK